MGKRKNGSKAKGLHVAGLAWREPQARQFKSSLLHRHHKVTLISKIWAYFLA
jgi:hypothetical protein